MGVSVHVPLRIRWPGDAPGDAGPAADRLSAAIGRGLDAALDRARDEVFAPRGGFVRARARRPEFIWCDPAGRMTGPARAVMQERIAAMIGAAIEQRRLDEAANALEVLPSGPSEPVDWARMRGTAYRLHSYDGEPGEAELPADAASAPRDDTSYIDYWWHWDGTEEALHRQMAVYVRAFHAQARPRFVGALFHGTRGGLTGMWGAQYELSWRGGGFEIGRWQAHFLTTVFRVIQERGLERRSEPPDGSYRHELIAAYAGADQLRTLTRVRLLEINGLALTPPVDESASNSRLRTVCEREVDSFVAHYGAKFGHVLSVLTTPLGSRYFLSVSRDFFLGRSSWTLQGLWETREAPAGSDGEGGGDRDDGDGDAADATGSPLADSDAPPGEGRASFFPRIDVGGETLALELSRFLEEPNVNDLGRSGEALKRLIRRIAYRLEMPEGEYCGAFLLAAAQVLGARASLVGHAAVSMPRATRRVEPGIGNLGDVDIVPEHTPAVQLLRFLAGTCPLVSELTRLMTRVYSLPLVHQSYLGRYRGSPAGWLLQFHIAHTPAMKDAVGHLYMRACQAMMLQVLRSSALEIDRRLDYFDAYFPVFEGLITGFVAEEVELRELRDTLLRVEAVFNPGIQTSVSLAVASWREARQALSSSISDQILNLSQDADLPELPRGEPFRRPDGSWAILAGNGREWTLAELEAAIAIRSGAASSIDPLINQLGNIPEIVDTFQNRPWMARTYLWSLLSEMKHNNTDIHDEVTGSHVYAFRSGKIREDLPNRTVTGTSVTLQGVHLLAHQAIGDAFEGNHWYGTALDHVFTVELGRLGLINFFETSLVLSLSVLCPPAGAVVGVVFAGVHYAQAAERLEISRAVMNPDELFDRAELELDLFMAELEIVLSIIPELSSIGRGAARGASVIGRRGVRRGAMRLGLEARRALVRSIAQQARRGLARTFVSAVLTDRAMAMLLPQVLGPVIAAVDAEIRMMTVGPTPPADASADAAPAGSAPSAGDSEERPTTPEGIAFYAHLDEYRPSPDEERRTPPEEQP